MLNSTLSPRSMEWNEAMSALVTAGTYDRSIPITSPVDFISGPRNVSTLVNFDIEKTGALTATKSRFGINPVPHSRSRRFLPNITCVAIRIIGIPVTFDMNGIVRDDLGFIRRVYSTIVSTSSPVNQMAG